MKTLSFNAWTGGHYIGLSTILLTIGRFILNMEWVLEVGEVAPGPGASLVDAAIPTRLTTMELMHLLTPDIQIIDGKATGYDEAGICVVSIVAVDSSSWDVGTESPEIYAAISECFAAVSAQ